MVVGTGKRIMAIGVAASGALALAAGAAPPPKAIEAAAAANLLRTDAALGVHSLSSTIRATVGEPTVVHFRTSTAAPFDRIAPATTTRPDRVSILDAGQVPAGQQLGAAIIEGRQAGFSTVEIAGVTFDVVVSEPATRAADTAILTPIDGAAIWGRIQIGATWWRPTQPSEQPPRLRVLGGDGHVLDEIEKPTWANTAAQGPTALAAYELDAGALPAGNVRIELVWPGEATAITSLGLRVMHPADSALVRGECEATYDLPPLPEERKEPKPNIGKHKDASGGEFFSNAGTTPRFRIPLEVTPEQGSGWYQVIARAGGDMAAATLPAVGVNTNEAQYPLTRSALAMPGFHRVPVGLPVRLEPGSHVVRLDFLNDFYGGPGVDRNLRLDAIEILRVADAGAASTNAPIMGDASMMAMTAGDATGGEMMTAAAARGDMMAVSEMTGASGHGRDEGNWPADVAAKARRATPPLITFARGWDDAPVAGTLDVRAAAWWPNIGDVQAIKFGGTGRESVTLLINGQPSPRQYSAAPRFAVPTAALKNGGNTLQLVLDTRDGSIMSSEARVVADIGAIDPPGASAFHRFAVHDPRWSAAARALAITEQNPPELACFGLMSEGTLELALPGGLEGEYELELEARGTSFNGAAELAIRLACDGEPSRILGVMALGGGWDPVTVLEGTPADRNRRAAVISFDAGSSPATLSVSFINDLYEPEKGDRNAFVQAVALRPRTPSEVEKAGPRGTIVWPRDGETMRTDAASAIVLAPGGAAMARTAEVVIDGEQTGQIVDLRGRVGPLVVPVSLRGIQPGEHDVTLRLEGAGTQSLTLAGCRINVVAADASPTAYDRAVTLLDRVGFGPDERQLAQVLILGEDEYVTRQLAAEADDAEVARAHTLATIRYRNSSSGGDVQRRAILEALATENPVRYRFVLFAQNHFSTWIRKTESRRKADEHDRFCQLGVAPFGELLRASATSPAMLRYLDQEQSFVRRLNENYAREIMELHTLGVNGGYTQDDVTTLARMLTGWTTAREPYVAADEPMDAGVGPDEYGMREVFRYDPALADGETRMFLGRRFVAPPPVARHQRVLAAIGMLAGHPSTANFVSRKLVAHLAAHPAPPELVEQLTSTFEQTGGDMKEVLRTLATSDDLHRASSRLAHPPIFAFRLARAAGSNDANAVHDFLNLSGQGMFDRSTPDGYPESDAEVTDSNAMLQRWKFAKRLEGSLFELVPSSRRYGDKPIGDDESAATIDLLAMRLTGRLLGEHSHAAALELLGKTEGKRDDRLRALAVFIASTPEAQLR